MAAHFHFGERIIIELNTKEIFEGDYADGSANRIDIRNVKQNNRKFLGEGEIYSFYRNEILKVYRCKEKQKKFDEPVEECKDTTTEKITIDEEENNRLREIALNYIYMENRDTRFFEACKILSDAETIGVVALGMEPDRWSTIKLLVISTWKQVYIFDCTDIKVKNFPSELKEIFECNYITKVIHGAAHLLDCFHKIYNVCVENVFDTQIVDLILIKRETGKCNKNLRLLSHCLTHYFNLPASLLHDAMEVPNKKWAKKPLSEIRKFHAAQLATYLLTLKQHMQTLLLKDVYNAIDNVHRLYLKQQDYEFKKKIHETICTKDIRELIPDLQKLNLSPATTDNTKSETGPYPPDHIP